jgi:putative transposase
MSAPDRHALVGRDHPGLSIRQQCELLGIARSGVYRAALAANDDDDLELMRRIDELFAIWPFLGSRRMTAMLRREGQAINRKRVRRLMRKTAITTLGPKRRLSKPAHKIFPNLLGVIAIERPNQVWCADIFGSSGLSLPRSDHGLASRAVLSWRLPNTVGRVVLSLLKAAGVGISMDDRVRWRDNVFQAAGALAQARGRLPERLC